MRRGPEKELIEDPLRKFVAENGGTAELFRLPSRRGAPDLLITFPFQPMHFVECKKPKGGELAPLQRKDHDRRRSMGQEVYLVWTLDHLNAYKNLMLWRKLHAHRMTAQ